MATDLCEQLARREHEVMLVGLFDPANRTEADTLTARLDHVADLAGPKRRGFSFSRTLALRRTVQRFCPDIVQANAFNALKFTALVRWASNACWPLVYRNVGLASRWVTRPGQRLWGRFLLRQVDQVISVSEASRQDFSRTYRMPGERIHVTRQGVRIPHLSLDGQPRLRLAELVGCQADVPLLVHVGNYSPEKNHTGLLEAFCLIRNDHPSSHLILFGDGPLRLEIEKQTDHLGISQSVHVMGPRIDAADLVAGADLMLLSSHVEGIPGAVLEACARAVPVVATDVGGMREIIQDQITGRLVPPGDMNGLAREASSLLGDEKRRKQMGRTARDFVAQHHDIAGSVDELEAMYSDLIGRRTRMAPA